MAESRGGEQAASLRVAEQWVGAWREIAKASNTLVVPANPGDASAMVAQAMSIFRHVGGPPTSDNSFSVPPAPAPTLDKLRRTEDVAEAEEGNSSGTER